jgi:hypothetical protein
LLRFRAKVPKPLFWKRSKFENAIKDVGNRLNDRVETTYDNITKTWVNKPVFTKRVGGSVLGKSIFSYGAIYASVTTDSDIYWYVTKGTKPHPIDPKPDNLKGMLIFRRDFKPKTSPNSLTSVAGGKSGPWRMAQHVDHPGAKARNFEAQIMKEQIPMIEKDLREALNKQVKIDVETLS